MLQKTVNICGKDVNFRSSASVPRLYRAKFGRDIFKDLSKLEKAYKDMGAQVSRNFKYQRASLR